MSIDLDQLAKVANLPGKKEVVSRSWLRQVLEELTAARIAEEKRNATIVEIAKIFDVSPDMVSPQPVGFPVPSHAPLRPAVG